MRNKKKSTKNRLTSLPVLPHPSSADLRGKQSVRSTFRLSQSAINMLSIVSTHLGIKQKSLFDHLMEDMDSLSQIAQEILPEYPEPSLKIQKTYVLSRKTVISLDSVCKNYKTPRDALVEYSIHRLLPVIEKEKEKHKEAILAALEPLYEEIKINGVYGERMIINSAFLVDKDKEVEFDQQVQGLDARYSDKIKFKYVGTLPPFNFINLTINTKEY